MNSINLKARGNSVKNVNYVKLCKKHITLYFQGSKNQTFIPVFPMKYKKITVFPKKYRNLSAGRG